MGNTFEILSNQNLLNKALVIHCLNLLLSNIFLLWYLINLARHFSSYPKGLDNGINEKQPKC